MELLGDDVDDQKHQKIMNMVNVMDKFSYMHNNLPYVSENHKAKSDQRSKHFISAYEQKTKQRGLYNLHKILPLMPNNAQNMLMVYTKLIEIKILSEMLEEISVDDDSRNAYKYDFFQVIQDNIPGHIKPKFDKVIEMIGILEIMKEVSENE